MSFSLTVEEENDLLVLRTSGASGASDLLAALQQASALTAVRPSMNVLLDRRESEMIVNPQQVREIVGAMNHLRGIYRGRIALITRPGMPYGMARVFQAWCETIDLTVAVFTEEPQAREWLRLPRAQGPGA